MKKYFFPSLGEALDQAIELKRLSYADFAREFECDKAQLSRWINNKTMPYQRTIKELEFFLDVKFSKENDGWSLMPYDFAKHGDISLDRQNPTGSSYEYNVEILDRCVSELETMIVAYKRLKAGKNKSDEEKNLMLEGFRSRLKRLGEKFGI